MGQRGVFRLSGLAFFLLIPLLSVFSEGYRSSLPDKTTFDQFSGLPLVGKYGQVSSVKVFYEIQEDKLYYLNNHNFSFHYDFCSEVLDHTVDLETFNAYNYVDHPRRKYLLANVNYYRTMDLYAMEFSDADEVTLPQILLLWNRVTQSFYVGKDLRLLVSNGRIYDMRAQLEDTVPLLMPSEVYGELSFQAVSKRSCVGRLRYVANLDSMRGELLPSDIIVLNKSPLSLPQVAGVIVTEFQTPLSHLSILGQNRKMPVAAYKDAFRDRQLRSYEGKNVEFEVASDTFHLKEIAKLKRRKERKKPYRMDYDLSVAHLVRLDSVDRLAYRYMGHKACNFALLSRLSREEGSAFLVPECGFAIPFYFYQQHAIRSGAKPLIEDLIKQGAKWNDQQVTERLTEIRSLILSCSMDSALVKAVDRQVADCGYEKMRFRSSTNAEDAAWFSGAGLYDSKSGVLGSSKKSFEKAIKTVWASLWSYAAYMEREYYKIDHSCAFMGVLAHRAFPSEAVNGVAVTKNLYREEYPGYTVNAQLGSENVVNPSPGVVCDQFICVPWQLGILYEEKRPIDIITQSNLTNGHLTMATEEIKQLADQLQIIHDYFYAQLRINLLYQDFAVDVEFKLDGPERKLYVKQVRPYNY